MRSAVVAVICLAACGGAAKGTGPSNAERGAAAASTHPFDWLPDKPLLVIAVRIDDQMRPGMQAMFMEEKGSCSETALASVQEIVKVQEALEDKNTVVGFRVSADGTLDEVIKCLGSTKLESGGTNRYTLTRADGKQLHAFVRTPWLIFTNDGSRLEAYTRVHAPPTKTATLLTSASSRAVAYGAMTLDPSDRAYGTPMIQATAEFIRLGEKIMMVAKTEWGDAATATAAAKQLVGFFETANADGAHVELRMDATAMTAAVFPFFK